MRIEKRSIKQDYPGLSEEAKSGVKLFNKQIFDYCIIQK